MSGHPSAVGRAQDSESSPVKDQRSTAAPQVSEATTYRAPNVSNESTKMQ